MHRGNPRQYLRRIHLCQCQSWPGRARRGFLQHSSDQCGDSDSLGATSVDATLPTANWVQLSLPNGKIPAGVKGVRVQLIDQLHAGDPVGYALFDHVNFEIVTVPVTLQSLQVQ